MKKSVETIGSAIRIAAAFLIAAFAAALPVTVHAGGGPIENPDGPPSVARVFLVAEDLTDPGAAALLETLKSLPSTTLSVWNVKTQGNVPGKQVFDHIGGAVIRHYGDCGGIGRLSEDELYLYEEYMGSRGNFMMIGRNFAPSFYATPFFKDELFTQIKGHDQTVTGLKAPQSKVFAAAAEFGVKQPNKCDVYEYMDLLLSAGPNGECVGTFGET